MLVSRFLFAVGAALVLGGVAGITLAIVDPELVLAQLPPLAIDAAAVGGAVAALGASALAVGAAHLLVAAGIARGAAWSRTAGVVLCATFGTALLAGAVAALVSAGYGAGFVAGAVALSMLSVAYAITAGTIVAGVRPDRSTEEDPRA